MSFQFFQLKFDITYEDMCCYYALINELQCLVQVWDLDSLQCKYTLSGHWDIVNCLDFFAHDDQQYLITGSSDCSAKVCYFY